MKKHVIAIYATTILLSLAGMAFIYSASRYSAAIESGDAFFYVKKQAIAFAIGLFLMFAVRIFDVEKLKKAKYPVMFSSLILLALVFVPKLGVESFGAKRWINLGFFTIQPSEYAKFGFVIFAAAVCADDNVNNTKTLLKILFFGIFSCILIILEPNMSITVCLGAVMLVMLYVGGLKTKKFAAVLAPAVFAIPVLIVAEPYRMKRLLAFLNPWENPKGEGYQLIQSYYALGSGGFFGLGYLNSRQKYLFLPFSESDFVLSVIGEETGVFRSNDSCNNLHSFRIFGHKNRDKRKNPIQKLPCDWNHRNRRDSERDKFRGRKRRDSADGVAASFRQRGRQ